MAQSKHLHLSLLLGMLLVAGCGQFALKDSASNTNKTAAAVAETDDPATPAVVENLPKQALTPEILYQFLIAEIAGQRGDLALSKSAYLDLAKKTKDPRLARRAAEVAVFARDQAGALEAARVWSAADQDSTQANQTLASLLLSQDKFAEAEPLLKKMLATDPAGGFMRLAPWFGKSRDTQGALLLVQRLSMDYPMLPESQFAVAQAAVAADKPGVALPALQRADTLRPGWEPAALYQAQWLAKTSRADALAYLRGFLDKYPKARDTRLVYARMLVSANRFADARKEYARLTQDFPRNAEISLAAGLLSLQVGENGAAQGYLMQALEYGYKSPDTVHYYLGLLAEERKQPAEAAQYYQSVTDGEYLVQARSRQAALLVKQGKLTEARALLAATLADNDAQKMRLIQAEADLLREARDYAQAYQVLSNGLKAYPDSPDLLYDRAMMAEKVDKLDVLEADLRRVIQIKPDEAQAYNALGYTLADRTPRLDEALELLNKALALAPEDPFILDSMGWAQYRKGNFVRAREYLDRAYKVRPDPEIAAHLGEVLWAHGLRDDASTLWQASLKTHPQNEVLLETVHRLKP